MTADLEVGATPANCIPSSADFFCDAAIQRAPTSGSGSPTDRSSSVRWKVGRREGACLEAESEGSTSSLKVFH